jgi:hypothetical protein
MGLVRTIAFAYLAQGLTRCPPTAMAGIPARVWAVGCSGPVWRWTDSAESMPGSEFAAALGGRRERMRMAPVRKKTCCGYKTDASRQQVRSSVWRESRRGVTAMKARGSQWFRPAWRPKGPSRESVPGDARDDAIVFGFGSGEKHRKYRAETDSSRAPQISSVPRLGPVAPVALPGFRFLPSLTPTCSRCGWFVVSRGLVSSASCRFVASFTGNGSWSTVSANP